MMKNYDTDDTFLGRWLAGELSEEELIQFKKTDAYKQFKLINEESQQLTGPDIDVEAALQNVKQKLQSKTIKPKTIQLWKPISVAALLLLSLGLLFTSSKTIRNGIGTTEIIALEDGSTVKLNANSSISYKRFFWLNNKEVKLTGEAFFSVNKGDGFAVETSKGKVRVLGTKFNIKDRTDFELQCYEGKVSFSQKNNATSEPHILTKGMQISIEQDKLKSVTFNETTPSWTEGLSKFKAKPLAIVLEELTHYYDISFKSNEIDTSRLYTGSFAHDNLEKALQSTLLPMGITYNVENNICILSN